MARERGGHVVWNITARLGLLVAAAGLTGCSRGAPEPLPEPLLTGPVKSPAVLTAGDVIEVKFFSTPELNELQAIRPDGKIMMHLVGEVVAQGCTAAELAQTLRGLYKSQLRDAFPVVLVRSFSTRRVYVLGAVLRPGPVSIPGPPLSVLEAVGMAGGPDPATAETRSVLVIRRQQDGRYQGIRVNMKEALDGRTAAVGCLLPQDIVYVPRTWVARADQWVSQHINQLVPKLGLTYSHTETDPGKASTVGADLTSGD